MDARHGVLHMGPHAAYVSLLPCDRDVRADRAACLCACVCFGADVLGNVNKLTDPVAHAEAIDCVSMVVDILISTGRSAPKGRRMLLLSLLSFLPT